MKRTPLRRKTPLRQTGFKKRSASPKVYKPRAEGDKVTPQLHQFILARDGCCMAVVLDKALTSLCTDTFGNVLVHGSYSALSKLELDHVPEENQTTMGDRPLSDPEHLIAICPNHHRYTGWATSKHGRTLERAYLMSLRRG